MPEDRSVCRDFERGVCDRGERCRYYHPDGGAPADGAKLPICKDFQNKGCSRVKCKFLHITAEEEADYNSTGKLPEHGGNSMKVSKNPISDKDVCKDFLNNKCDRGARCKFSHVGGEELQFDRSGHYGKRPHGEDYYGVPQPPDDVLIEENAYLRQKVADLQREATELRQMNDTLYDQNTHYRSQVQKCSSRVTSQYIDGYSQVVYPQYSHGAYPPKTAAVPIASTAGGVSPYNCQQY